MAELPAGAFIAFEGGEGAGKSTQVAKLAAALRAQGRQVHTTREPGGTALGDAIRELLLGHGSAGMSARTEALLFAAARAEHAAAVLRPARAAGVVVISDRYRDSSIAYQGGARGLGTQAIADLSTWATEGLLPDLTILLDVPPLLGLRRAGDPNRMEAEPTEFHEQVRAAFLQQADQDPNRYLILPADRPVAELAEAILQAVSAILEGLPTTLPHPTPGSGTGGWTEVISGEVEP